MITKNISKRVYQPEVELLLSCARTQMDAENALQVQALVQTGLDWNVLLSMAGRNGMTPLLFKHLRDHSLEGIPKYVLGYLRDYYRHNAVRNLLLIETLLDLLDQFKLEGIKAIPFKGPVLAASLYGDLALREFGDLDILIRRHDLFRANELLISLGFQPEFQSPSKKEALYLQCEHSFSHEAAGTLVDLHWTLEPTYFSFASDLEALWGRLESVSLEGREISSLCPQDLFTALCIHGARHAWERLDWICDLGEFLCIHTDMDWYRLLEQAHSRGCKRMISLGLYLARELLGVDITEKLGNQLQVDHVVRSLADQVYERLFLQTNDEDRLLERRYSYVRTMDRFRDRIRHCYDLLITPTPLEWELLRLPASLFFLYYLIRPMRLAAKYMTAPMRLISHAN